MLVETTATKLHRPGARAWEIPGKLLWVACYFTYFTSVTLLVDGRHLVIQENVAQNAQTRDTRAPPTSGSHPEGGAVAGRAHHDDTTG